MTYYIIIQVILFDLNSARYKLEEWRSELWDLAHIGMPDSDTESQDSLMFGQLTCWFISEVTITYIHTHTHIHTHTYAYIHIHTYIDAHVRTYHIPYYLLG